VVHVGLRVVVTGGAGFIGSRIAASYARDGFHAVVIDDLSSGEPHSIPPGVRLLVHDVADPGVAEVLAAQAPNLVIHAAAQVSVPRSLADPARDEIVNVGGTAHIIDGARAAGARLVFLSSGGAIYGDADGADEDWPPRPISPYGEHKLEAERAISHSGISYGIARLSNVYGPGQRADLEGGVVATFVDCVRTQKSVEVHGDGSQRRDFIHVDDVVRAIRLIGAATRDGVWNVASGASTSIIELLRLVEQIAGPAGSVVHLPRRAGDVTVSRLLVDRIRQDLGWKPSIGLGEGLSGLISVPTERA
jgi:UDP-glucose 4-epimerase